MKTGGPHTVLRLAAGILALFLVAGSARAEDLKLKVSLIWGTNDATPPGTNSNAKLKAISADDPLVKKFSSMFKWKFYYVVNAKEFELPNRATKSVMLSQKCEVKVTELEGPNIEVQVVGEGKLVKTVKSTLSKQETLAFAGNDKNDCAWFIYFQQK